MNTETSLHNAESFRTSEVNNIPVFYQGNTWVEPLLETGLKVFLSFYRQMQGQDLIPGKGTSFNIPLLIPPALVLSLTFDTV
jgi:hypothetical protein